MDPAYARPVESEVLDLAWDGPVDQVAARCQADVVHRADPWIHHNRRRLDSWCIREGAMNGGKDDCAPHLRVVSLPVAF